MDAITNNKLADLTPRWAEFRGFTLLFDNPGRSLRREDSLEYVDTNPDLPLYRGLRAALQQLHPADLATRHLFFALDPRSYHVTACDGGNVDNEAAMKEAYRPVLRNYLQGMPGSVADGNPFAGVLEDSPLLRRKDWGLRFAFDRIANWSGVSLVACLKPADDAAAEHLAVFSADRQRLCEQLLENFGIAPPWNFVPHITLGYFANRARGQAFGEPPEAWQDLFRACVGVETLAVESLSLYGFTDMETFFRRRPGEPVPGPVLTSSAAG